MSRSSLKILRQSRKGSASEFARACIANLGFLMDAGGIQRDPATGRYRVHVPAMRTAIESLAERYLHLQGDGDYVGALAFIPKQLEPTASLAADLGRLAAADIPTGIRS